MAGCATIPEGAAERRAETMASLVEVGDTGGLLAASATPFLFDGEIVVLERDLQLIWDAITDIGLGTVSVVETAPASEVGSEVFGITEGARVFLTRGLDRKARLVTLRTDRGPLWLLVGAGDAGYLYGVRGFE